MVAASSGTITTIAGTGKAGLDGDYGPAARAVLHLPTAVAVDKAGNLYICDSANNVIRQVSNGIIIPYLGNYIPGYTGDTTGTISMNDPTDIFFDANYNMWIADFGNGRIREYGTNGISSTVVGGGTTYTEGGFPLASALAGPHSVAVDPSGANIYVADADDNRIRKINVAANKITTLAGAGSYGFSGDGGAANAAQVNTPYSVAVDGSGNVYFVDLFNARIRMVSASGIVTTVAGNGATHYSGDGGAAQNALLNAPSAVAYSSTGVYVADTNNQRIRQIGPSGSITTIAGSGTPGFAGDGGPAASAQVSFPFALAVDASGFLYIADTGNQRVRKIVNGTINTVAGNGNTGYTGDGGQATAATFASPAGLAVDSAGDIYISDYGNNVVRKVSVTGVISTVAGNGSPGYSGDGGQAISAQLTGPLGLALDAAGNLYIADSGNHVIRIVAPGGKIGTFAGTGVLGDANDGGPAANAQLASPAGLAFDSSGNLYIADSGANRVRLVTPAGLIVTIGGNGTTGYSGDAGPANQAQFNTISGIALDVSGDVYVADQGNNAIRLMQFVSPVPSAGALANAATNILGAVAPGEAATIYGSGIGPANIVSSQPDAFGNIPEKLAGTVVYFNGVPAPIVYTWAQQIGIVVPYEATPGTSLVAVQFGNQVSLELPVTIVASAPGLYTADGSGKGQAMAVNHESGVTNTSATPEPHGGVITVYVTGVGEVSPSVPDGTPNTPGTAHPLQPMSATIGGVNAAIQYAGGDNGLAPGMIRMDLAVPSTVTGNAVPVVVTFGTASSQPGVTVAIN